MHNNNFNTIMIPFQFLKNSNFCKNYEFFILLKFPVHAYLETSSNIILLIVSDYFGSECKYGTIIFLNA